MTKKEPRSYLLQQVEASASLPPELQEELDRLAGLARRLERGRPSRSLAGQVAAAESKVMRTPIPTSLGGALKALKLLLRNSSDLIIRGVLIGRSRPGVILYFAGFADIERLEASVLHQLVRCAAEGPAPPETPEGILAWLEGVGLAASNLQLLHSVGEAVHAALAGNAVLLVEGLGQAMRIGVQPGEMRSVDEPSSEVVLRGPREGFVEDLSTNLTLLRRRIGGTGLRIEALTLGLRTRTKVAVVYLSGVASPAIVREVKRRVRRVKVDGVMDTGTLEEFIEDHPGSPFPQLFDTERPDRVAASLLEGRVAILVDGSPFALVAPCTLWLLLQAADDYYQRHFVATFFRWLRYIFMILSLLGPSLYIAITTFHQEMLPTPLLISIAAAREGTPLPALAEALFMEIFFEVLREAGVRLPRQVGQAVSIVGALVIGQAAVQAGMISAPMVIVVAATGIASFIFPRDSLSVAFRLLRFPLAILSGSFGLLGMLFGCLAILIHLCALRSFGVPYLKPITPAHRGDLKDVLIRAPLWRLDTRPEGMGALQQKRKGTSLKPTPRRDGA